jgi:hypothetical protein
MRASQFLLVGSVSVFFTIGAVACGDSGGTTSGSGASGPGSGGGTTSTATGMGGAGTTTTTTTSTSSGPLMCPSAVTNIPVGECDLFLQDCPNTNQTCAFVDAGAGGGGGASTTTACVTANGLKTLGQDCANQGECAAGLFCIGDPGKCTAACCPDTDEPCMGGSCNQIINVGGTAPNELTFMACSFAAMCTLFTPDSCVAGEDCHLDGPGFATCSQPSPTPKMEGEACMYVNDCGDSQICAGNMTDGYFCRYLCQIGSSAAAGLGGCPANQTCDGGFDTGFTDVGLCVP